MTFLIPLSMKNTLKTIAKINLDGADSHGLLPLKSHQALTKKSRATQFAHLLIATRTIHLEKITKDITMSTGTGMVTSNLMPMLKVTQSATALAALNTSTQSQKILTQWIIQFQTLDLTVISWTAVVTCKMLKKLMGLLPSILQRFHLQLMKLSSS